MNYEKPEVVVLGESADLIQSNKLGGSESNLAAERIVPGSELND
jgi:hypothetical protein